VGHFDQFGPINPTVGYLFGEETFAGATRNGKDAPMNEPARAGMRV